MAGENAKQTKQSLECALGREVCGGELYAAHFLGPSGARRLIQLNDSDPNARADLAFPQAAKANRSTFYHANGTSKTVGELYSTITDQPSSSPPSSPKPTTPVPQMIAADQSGKDAAAIMSAFAQPSPSVTTVPPSGSDDSDQRSAAALFSRGWTQTARNVFPVAVPVLPQPSMVLSPGIVEILASLSPAKMMSSAA
jgi:hypothetical protein